MASYMQSDKISHIDIQDDSIDTVISHIHTTYPISTSRMTISIWWMTISINHIPYRYSIFHIDTHIDIPLMSDIPYRYPISISYIDIPIISGHSVCQALTDGCFVDLLRIPGTLKLPPPSVRHATCNLHCLFANTPVMCKVF